MGKKRSEPSDYWERRFATLAESPYFYIGFLSGKYHSLKPEMDHLAALVSNDPVRRTGALLRAAAREGGNARRGKLKSDTSKMIAAKLSGKSYGKIAQDFGYSVGTVKSRLRPHLRKIDRKKKG